MAKRPTLFLGSSNPAVALLVQKLRAQGNWPSENAPKTFTAEVERQVQYFQMTHLGPEGLPLDADGVVGDQTWWALFHPSGKAQRSGIEASIPSGLGKGRVSLLEVALAEHAKDVKEQPGGSNRGPEIDKYLPNHWKQAKGPAWCCFFYSWVVHEALGAWPLGKREGSCANARKLAGSKGLWTPKYQVESTGPVPGDAFVMDKGGGSGHIGYVLRVSEDASRINTLEGNCGNRVKLGLRDLGDPQIVGFINNVPAERSPGFERGVVDAPKVGGDGTR